ncbi:hypothetical protein MHYP_G00359490 [Metynnis hypsauchen]
MSARTAEQRVSIELSSSRSASLRSSLLENLPEAPHHHRHRPDPETSRDVQRRREPPRAVAVLFREFQCGA